MKSFATILFTIFGCALLASAHARTTAVAKAAPTEPTVALVRGKLAVVQVPAGFDRVTLQALVVPPRGSVATLGAAPAPQWQTVGSKLTQGKAGNIVFHLSRLTPKRMLRTYGTKRDSLPTSLLSGPTAFSPEAPGGSTGSGVTLSGTDAGGSPLAGSVASISNSSSSTQAPRTVVESDIWKIDGDRLYFFNELRGLQVFDIAKPDDPALLGSLRMPGVGEEMYLLDSQHAVLLKNDGWWGWIDWNYRWGGGGGPILTLNSSPVGIATTNATTLAPGSANLTLSASTSAIASANLVVRPIAQATSGNAVVVADVSSGTPSVLAQVPFTGNLRESRLVGNVLYVATDVYGTPDGSAFSQWGCHLSSFDLSDPAHPVQRASLQLGGWANAVAATDRYFLVAKWGSGGGNVVDVVDISDPTGLMTSVGEVSVPGYVQDKFKMTVAGGDTLTVVSAVSGFQVGDSGVATWSSNTNVSTYTLAGATPAVMGTLDFAENEALHATRFDGSRLYVVTADRTAQPWDPLWIVDLTNPAKPTVLGNLQIPGFSTYIEPLGDRLVTTGLLNWQPSVSLYDVHDAANPVQLSSVSLASTDGWSNSEATWDEKAFNVLPDDNLILLPISGYNSTDGYASGVQILDLLPDKLVKRGVIKHQFYPRRATVHASRIVSISPSKLVSVNASDRDNPVVTGEIEISWPVDRVFLAGDYLVQLAVGNDWQGNAPSLMVAAAKNPDDVVTSLDLANIPVVGTTVRNGVLYVLQARSVWDVTPVANSTGKAATLAGSPDPQNAILASYDIAHLPALRQLASIAAPAGLMEEPWNTTPLWVSDRTLLWVQTSYNNWWQPIWYVPVVQSNAGTSGTVTAGASATKLVSGGTVNAITGYWWRGWVYSRARKLFAFDVSAPDQPRYTSTLPLGVNEGRDVSDPLSLNGTVYVGYKDLGKVSPDANHPAQGDGSMENQYFLELVEYADPATPTVHDDRINLPGELRGVSRDGQLLYTLGQSYDLSTGVRDGKGTALHVSGFDGVAAHLSDQIALTDPWQPFVLSGETLFLMHPRPSYTFGWYPPILAMTAASADSPTASNSTLETLKVGDDGKFASLETLALDHESAVNLFGSLAVVRANDRTVRLIDARDPSALVDLGVHRFEGSAWPSLQYADGDVQRGLWVPLGPYGVEPILLVPAVAQ